jgi:signal transduction histidine kinase
LSHGRNTARHHHRSVARYFFWGGSALAALTILVGGIALAFLDLARGQTKTMQEVYWPRSVAAQRLAVDASHLTTLTAELPNLSGNAERRTTLQRIEGIKLALTADIDMLRAAGLNEINLNATITAEQALLDGIEALNDVAQIGIDLRTDLARQKNLARANCEILSKSPECRTVLWALAALSDDILVTGSVPGLEAVAVAQRAMINNDQRRINLLRRQSDLAARFLFLASSQSDDAAREIARQQEDIVAWAGRIEWVLTATMLAALLLALALRWFFSRRVIQRVEALETAMVNWREDGALPTAFPAAAKRYPDEIDAMALALRELLGEIASRTADLTRSNAELEQFAYVTSHDLRQPLRMVTSYLALIERSLKDRLDDDTRTFMAFASGGAKKMDRLILDLLEYSRTGRLDTPQEPIMLSAVVDDALQNLGAAISDAKAVVTIQPDLPTLSGHRSELVRLFQNLIGNAIKYCPSDRIPDVSVTCRRDGKVWVIAVLDNGIGIDSNQFERVFGVFQRLHTSAQYEGTGIGLAVCRKIVEHHGGRIWVESEEGKGSVFLFTVPAEETPGLETETATAIPA